MGISVRPEVEQKIVELITSGRRYFGSSGASLTHEVHGRGNSGFSSKAVEIGLQGERNTTRMLREWIADKPNTVLVDSVHLVAKNKKNSDEVSDGKDTDHVLIIGNTIVLIDSKAWRKNYRYAITPKGTISRGGRAFRGGKVHMGAAIHLWRKFFPQANKILAYVCIQQTNVTVTYNTQWKKSPYKLIPRQDLHRSLNWVYEQAGGEKAVLDTHMVSQIIVSAIKPLNILATVLNHQRFNV